MVQVRRVAGHIGAEVTGLDLARPLDSATVAEVRLAVLTHKVVFFRNQRLGHAEHIAFARQFGEVLRRVRPQSTPDLDAYPQIWTISPEVDKEQYGVDHEERFRLRMVSSMAGWHTDLSNAVAPPAASVLRAERVPEFGGDTAWTNLVAAYQGLSPDVQRLAYGLRAEHVFFAGLDMDERDPTDAEIIELVNSSAEVSVHPVVRVHPETGERALFVNPARTSRIVGVSPVQSRHLLDLFFDQVTRPEYTVRFRWDVGSVAFWDNRATAHVAIGDYAHTKQPRRMHRVTILGDRPVGPDGYVSEGVAREPVTVTTG